MSKDKIEAIVYNADGRIGKLYKINKTNKEWVEKMAREGYDIYDKGNLKSLAGESLSANWRSLF